LSQADIRKEGQVKIALNFQRLYILFHPSDNQEDAKIYFLFFVAKKMLASLLLNKFGKIKCLHRLSLTILELLVYLNIV